MKLEHVWCVMSMKYMKVDLDSLLSWWGWMKNTKITKNPKDTLLSLTKNTNLCYTKLKWKPKISLPLFPPLAVVNVGESVSDIVCLIVVSLFGIYGIKIDRLNGKTCITCLCRDIRGKLANSMHSCDVRRGVWGSRKRLCLQIVFVVVLCDWKEWLWKEAS